ncbi:MAG: agmatine deiminase family protein, partial [Clostridia bacterium]|nr:agmatine deiminase family protein [Clostridia bacterium]
MGKSVMFLLVICIIISLMPLGNAETLTLPKYYMPLEDELHEGTWLQWPHDYTYGYGNRKELEDIWIEMTKELAKGENVHIIAYNRTEKKHIKKVLNKANVDMSKVDFYLFKTNDTWIRDNGPIFVYDDQDDLVITNWEFNGWGEKYPYFHDNLIPKKISNAIHVLREDINMVLEGGAIEHDGNGTCMATLTSIVNDNRNPGLTVEDVEEYLTYYLGFTNFIWLDGTISENDVTDCHIDGFVKFVNDEKIVTMSDEDLQYWGLSVKDCATLYNAQNANGIQYDFV